jgi:hypothetical protein
VNAFQNSIKWIMLISGLLTCATSYVLFAPEASLRSAFGVPITSPMALIVVRHWGALIGLFGLMLIYGAFKETVRRMVLLVTSAGKAIFISLVLSQGQQFALSHAGPGLVIDSITVLLFAAYLILSRNQIGR